MNLSVYLYTLRQKGYLAYEYNPLRNYLTDVDLYKVDTDVGEVLVPKDCAVNRKNGQILYKKSKSNDNIWIDNRGNLITDVIKDFDENNLYAKAGSLIDLDTDKLNFDLEHPVDITIQPSYDGSVNLILNDDKNIPRIINSRFSAREKNTYEIVDRIGENDTNIYKSSTFEKDTSLYFLYEYNPKIKYLGFVKGILPVGQYCFYFTYCDSDDNESDYIAETGVIPVFLGSDSDAASIDGGIKNQQTDKGIRLKLTNIDKSYNYIKVYYIRYFADYQLNRVSECKKIIKRYSVNSNTIYIQITGNEQTEDLDPNLLNISRFNPKSVLTQAQCKNILFFGNIVKNTDNYKELSDCALRISPKLVTSTIDTVDLDYQGEGYYNSLNMYNKVGYFNEEYYRFGVVFIYQNGTLSNVYNTLGGDLNEGSEIFAFDETKDSLWTIENAIATRNYIKVDDNGWIKEGDKYTIQGDNLNARGVCRLSFNDSNNTIAGIEFKVPEEVKTFLKNDLGIRGMFFVRQKCVPNILALCYILPIDLELEAPVLKLDDEFITECFVSQGTTETIEKTAPIIGTEFTTTNKIDDRLVVNSYTDRLYTYKHTDINDSDNAISKRAYAGICPDFLLNQPYYNQIFNGNSFKVKLLWKANLNKQGRLRFYEAHSNSNDGTIIANDVKICTVTDNVPTVAIEDLVYRLEIGETEEAFRFRYAEINNGSYDAGDEDYDAINGATNIVRGKYSPYLAIYSQTNLECGLYNIYLKTPLSVLLEFQNRMDSTEPFYAISDRYNFTEIAESLICWRGDCYINQFTYRLNRNFNDPSLPNNDEIIDKNTWKDNYDVTELEKWADISRSDLNAVLMGSWITFKVRSAMNYALRSNDHSYVAEENLMGAPRSYFPHSKLLFRGENKMPDSYLYNDAYRATLGYKCYFALHDINYIKDSFSNRIQYSAISILDSFKNNYRMSLSTYFRDYSLEYGSIQKLIGFEGYILVVFEHAIGVAVVNERVLAGGGDGEPVFINTQNVLPEELTIITDTYGTQWPESVIKSEAGYVYGVDTIAKKIWRVKGQQIEILSDFKVNKFLIDNISLSERELYPIVGLKNVKSHYNNNKKDIMFTFYDDVYKDEEKVWNLCYNELLDLFITYYSWIPSYSENIDTQFFTFDRNTSKLLSLLNKCNYNIPTNTGILVDIPILNENSCLLHYIIPERAKVTIVNEDGTTSMMDISAERNKYDSYEVNDITFKIEKDHWHNYKHFEINGGQLSIISEIPEESIKAQKGVLLLYVTPTILSENDTVVEVSDATLFKTEVIAITKKEWLQQYLREDFYLHGQAGIFNVAEDLYPTHWYGEYHPFEFEFVVNDKIGLQKIFNNLIMISNKAEPESFHFEIEGDNYNFSENKRWMYYKLEEAKKDRLDNGEDILYNRKYTDVAADKLTYEQAYQVGNYDKHYITSQPDSSGKTIKYVSGLVADRVYPEYKHGISNPVKPTKFPLYYERVDTYNDVYDKYLSIAVEEMDYLNLSGSEILWNRDLNQFNISTHVKNRPVDKVGRLRGNSHYKEGRWDILIPSINYNFVDIDGNDIPFNYFDENDNDIRKETRIRDKWIKIRVRYSGKNLAIIHSLVTLYNVSYS